MPELRRRFRKKIREIEESTEKISTLTIDNYKESIELFHNYNDEQYKIIEENTNRIVKESKSAYHRRENPGVISAFVIEIYSNPRK